MGPQEGNRPEGGGGQETLLQTRHCPRGCSVSRVHFTPAIGTVFPLSQRHLSPQHSRGDHQQRETGLGQAGRFPTLNPVLRGTGMQAFPFLSEGLSSHLTA